VLSIKNLKPVTNHAIALQPLLKITHNHLDANTSSAMTSEGQAFGCCFFTHSN